MASPSRVYVDACVWLSHIVGQQERAEVCEEMMRAARAREVDLWTSTMALAEVYKFDDGNGDSSGANNAFLELMSQDYVRLAQLDFDTAIEARQLLRKHKELKKPADGVHLATARRWNCHRLYTFDKQNLLPLDGLVQCLDGTWISITEPPQPVQSALQLSAGQSPSVSTSRATSPPTG